MLQKIVFIAVCIFTPSLVTAESLLCIAHKGVGLEKTKDGTLNVVSIDVSKLKISMYENEGKLRVKEYGNDSGLYIPCTSGPYLCTCGYDAWCGQFIRDKDNQFTYYIDKSYANGSDISQVVSGKCEPI